MNKKCSKCGKVKSIKDFGKVKLGKYGVRGVCKDCIKEQRRESYKNSFEYRKKLKERHKKWRRNRLKTNLKFRLNLELSSSIRQSLKGNKNGYHWEDLVDYKLKDLMIHLENQFKEGMNWNNRGDWHIDHIIPKSRFKFNSYEDPQFKQCWSLENLQPLWAEENWNKGNKILSR